jgi:hypothetical protein
VPDEEHDAMHDESLPVDGTVPPDDAAPDEEDLDPREEARIHRRDHDAEVHHRELLRPGMAKVFKQITDSWGEKASRDQDRAQKKAGKGPGRPQ